MKIASILILLTCSYCFGGSTEYFELMSSIKTKLRDGSFFSDLPLVTASIDTALSSGSLSGAQRDHLERAKSQIENINLLKLSTASCGSGSPSVKNIAASLNGALALELENTNIGCSKTVSIDGSSDSLAEDVFNLTNFLNIDQMQDMIGEEVLIANGKANLKHKKMYEREFDEKNIQKIVDQTCPIGVNICTDLFRERLSLELNRFNQSLKETNYRTPEKARQELLKLVKGLNESLSEIEVDIDEEESGLTDVPDYEKTQDALKKYYQFISKEMQNGVGGLLLTESISDEIGRIRSLSKENDDDLEDQNWYNPFVASKYSMELHQTELSLDEVEEAINEANQSIENAASQVHKMLQERTEKKEQARKLVDEAVNKDYASQVWSDHLYKGKLRNLAKLMPLYPKIFAKVMLANPQAAGLICHMLTDLEKMDDRDSYIKNSTDVLTYTGAVTGIGGLAVMGVKFGLRNSLAFTTKQSLSQFSNKALTVSVLAETDSLVGKTYLYNEASKKRENLADARQVEEPVYKKEGIDLVAAQIAEDHALFDMSLTAGALALPSTVLATLSALKRIPRSNVVSKRLPNGHLDDIQLTNKGAIEMLVVKLRAMPELRKDIVAMMRDPNVPEHIKAIVRKALVDDVEIVHLSESFKKLYGFPEYVGGFRGAEKVNSNVVEVPRQSSKSINVQVTEAVKNNKSKPLIIKNANLVGLAEKTSEGDMGPLLTMVHELAHVRYDKFFQNNIEKMVGKFPPDLLRRSEDGKVLIDEQLANYFTERFSHETEFYMLSPLRDKYNSFEKWKMVRDVPIKDVRREISQFVRQSYEITDPRIAELDARPLSDIFLNGME